MVEYRVPHGLPSLLEIECNVNSGTRDILEGGGVVPEQTSLRINADDLARVGIFTKVREGGIVRRDYRTWAYAGKGRAGRIMLWNLGLTEKQTAELTRDQVVAGLRKVSQHRRATTSVGPNDVERIPWTDYVVKAEVAVALGRDVNSDQGLPPLLLEADAPLHEVVYLKLRSLGDGMLRVEAPLGADCQNTLPR